MKILFDQGTPVPLRRSLLGHTVTILLAKDPACAIASCTNQKLGANNITSAKLLASRSGCG